MCMHSYQVWQEVFYLWPLLLCVKAEARLSESTLFSEQDISTFHMVC